MIEGVIKKKIISHKDRRGFFREIMKNDNKLTKIKFVQISHSKIKKSTISINNFVTSFEFLEENNDIGKESYLSNETSYRFNGNNKLLYKERQNRKTNLKEFYNLVYQYENDCLVASIQYNKDYYSDRELKPTEELFFSITIVPFANVGSPKVKK